MFPAFLRFSARREASRLVSFRGVDREIRGDELASRQTFDVPLARESRFPRSNPFPGSTYRPIDRNARTVLRRRPAASPRRTTAGSTWSRLHAGKPRHPPNLKHAKVPREKLRLEFPSPSVARRPNVGGTEGASIDFASFPSGSRDLSVAAIFPSADPPSRSRTRLRSRSHNRIGVP